MLPMYWINDKLNLMKKYVSLHIPLKQGGNETTVYSSLKWWFKRLNKILMRLYSYPLAIIQKNISYNNWMNYWFRLTIWSNLLKYTNQRRLEVHFTSNHNLNQLSEVFRNLTLALTISRIMVEVFPVSITDFTQFAFFLFLMFYIFLFFTFLFIFVKKNQFKIPWSIHS